MLWMGNVARSRLEIDWSRTGQEHQRPGAFSDYFTSKFASSRFSKS
jgi:hypothetical protein